MNNMSPWSQMQVEQLKEIRDRMKLENDIAVEEQRSGEILEAELKKQAPANAMQERLPYLET